MALAPSGFVRLMHSKSLLWARLKKPTVMWLLFILCGCGPMLVDEKSRSTDPSGKLDAIVVERGSDATVATPTQVFIAPKGEVIQPDSKSEPVVTADHVDKAKAVWASSGRVRIEFKGARIYRHLPMDQPNGVVIEVIVDGVQHKSALPAPPSP